MNATAHGPCRDTGIVETLLFFLIACLLLFGILDLCEISAIAGHVLEISFASSFVLTQGYAFWKRGWPDARPTMISLCIVTAGLLVLYLAFKHSLHSIILLALYFSMLFHTAFKYRKYQIAAFALPSLMAFLPTSICLAYEKPSMAAYFLVLGLVCGIKIVYFTRLKTTLKGFIESTFAKIGDNALVGSLFGASRREGNPAGEAETMPESSAGKGADRRVRSDDIYDVLRIYSYSDILKMNFYIGIARSLGFIVGSSVVIVLLTKFAIAGIEQLSIFSPELQARIEPLKAYVKKNVSPEFQQAIAPLSEYIMEKFSWSEVDTEDKGRDGKDTGGDAAAGTATKEGR